MISKLFQNTFISRVTTALTIEWQITGGLPLKSRNALDIYLNAVNVALKETVTRSRCAAFRTRDVLP